MRSLTSTETALLVDPIRSFLMVNAYAKPAILSAVVALAFFHALLVTSNSWVDVPCVLLTLFSRLKSMVVDALMVTTRTTSECVLRLS